MTYLNLYSNISQFLNFLFQIRSRMNNSIFPSQIEQQQPPTYISKQSPPIPPRGPQSPSNGSNKCHGSPGAGGGCRTSGGTLQVERTASSVVLGFGLIEESIAEGRAITADLCNFLRSYYTYKSQLVQDAGEVNSLFSDGCQNGFRALRYCSLAAPRIQALLSYVILNDIWVRGLILFIVSCSNDKYQGS